MTTLSSHEARQRFAQLLELAFYKDAKIQIKRNNKAMAWLVGDPFIHLVNHLIEQVVESHPQLADACTLTLDQELQQLIAASRREAQSGQTVPFEAILED